MANKLWRDRTSDEKAKEIQRVVQWQKQNPDKVRVYKATRYARRRQWLNDAKSQPCMDCGGRFPPECMDFDHRPGTDKKFIIGGELSHAMDDVLTEMAKCDLVCSNCHRIRTKQRRAQIAIRPVELRKGTW